MREGGSQRLKRAFREEHVQAATFLYAILETADRLRSARTFRGGEVFRSDAHYSLLEAVERCGGAPTLSDLGRALRVSRQWGRSLVLAAARAGRVQLFPDPYDRRAIQVELTPLGRQILDEHRLPDMAWKFTLLNGLEPRAMRSTAHVLHVLMRRLKRLEQMRATAPR